MEFFIGVLGWIIKSFALIGFFALVGLYMAGGIGCVIGLLVGGYFQFKIIA